MVLSFALALGLHVQPCTQGHAKAAALCGTYDVYEDRAAHAGRIIALHVVVLKAKHPTHKAIALIAGGPGEAATPYAQPIADAQFLRAYGSLRDSYDMIFMDDRGMGQSYAMSCDFAPQADPAVYFTQLFPDSTVAACRNKLNATHALALYNTNNTVDDLDDLRAALGYPKLVLWGGSYGTMFSLVYMRRHPEHVESAVLDGVAPPGFQPLPGEPVGAQTALDDLIAKCKRDATCNKNFPNFARHFDALVARLNKGPIPVTLQRKGARNITVEMSKEVFVDHLRQILYDPESASYVPYVIERAYQGDTVPLAQIVNLVATGLNDDLAMGAWLSYTCQEMVPFLDMEAVQHAAAHSFSGDLRIQAQLHACSMWNVPPMPASFNDPVRSDAPVLMISGSDDPATPPKYAQQAARYLPHAKIVLVKGAGHATETPCTDRLMAQFIKAASADGLDVDACSAAFTVPTFATSLKGLF